MSSRVIDPRRRTRNSDPQRLDVNVTVQRLLVAIADNDRWAMARRTTGPLLRKMLSSDEVDADGYACLQNARYIALDCHPLTVVDEDVAILVGAVTGLATPDAMPLTAVLIASDVGAPHWLIASLDIGDDSISTEVRENVVRGTFSDEADREVIAAAQPLDRRAAAINWNDPATVLRTLDDGRVHTVADMRVDLALFTTAAWPWLADDAPSFAGLHLRATHPELVREY